MLRTTILALALGLTVAPIAAALPPVAVTPATVDPARLIKARELVDAMHVSTQMREMMRPMMMRMMTAMAAGRVAAGGPAPTRAEQEHIDSAMSMMADEVGRLINGAMPQIVESTALAYARNLSVAEVEGAMAFYRTPTGQSLLAKQPQIMADMNNSTQAALIKPILAQMPAIIARIKAAQGDASSAAPAIGK